MPPAPPETATAPKPPTLSIPLGFAGALRLVAAPITEVTLDQPASERRITELDTEVVVSGTCKGFTEQTLSASLSWVIRYDSGDSAEYAVAGKMHIKGDRFEFKVARGKTAAPPRLDVLQHRLFGSGAIGYRLTPLYPHAPTAAVEAGKIRFDNVLGAKTKPERIGTALIGQPVVFALVRGALVDKLLDEGFEVRLRIEEEDSGKGERRARDDLQAELVWDGKSRGQTRSYLIGCTADSTSEAPKLAYPEAGEAGDYELGYRLYVGKPGDRWPVEAGKVRPLATMARPTLTSFALEIRRPFLGWMPAIIAKGTISGFHDQLEASVVLSLWRKGDRRGVYTQVSPSAESPQIVAALTKGAFEAELWESSFLAACYASPGTLESWLLSLPEPAAGAAPVPTLFASVRLNNTLPANPKVTAVQAALSFDAAAVDTIIEAAGVIGSPLAGTAICSAESKQGAALALQMKAAIQAIVTASREPGDDLPPIPWSRR